MSYASKVIIGNKTHLVGSNLYGICNSEASAVTKVVELPDFDRFLVGVTVHVKFTYSNTAAEPKININSLGEKPLYLYGTTYPGVTPDTSWDAGAVLSITYDGTAWIANDWINTNVGVQQVYTSEENDASYMVLFSGSDNLNDEVNITRKDSRLRYNPATHRLYVGRMMAADTDKHYGDDPEDYAIDVRDSDIINCNAIWFKDPANDDDSIYEGLMFKRTAPNDYDILYCRDGVLYVEQQCSVPTDESGTLHNTRGTIRKMMSDINMPSQNRIRGGTVSKNVTVNADNWAVLFTAQEVNEILGVTNSNSGNTSMSVANGHYQAYPYAIDGVAYNTSDSKWYVHFATRPTAGSTCRFNYIIYYWV